MEDDAPRAADCPAGVGERLQCRYGDHRSTRREREALDRGQPNPQSGERSRTGANREDLDVVKIRVVRREQTEQVARKPLTVGTFGGPPEDQPSRVDPDASATLPARVAVSRAKMITTDPPHRTSGLYRQRRYRSPGGASRLTALCSVEDGRYASSSRPARRRSAALGIQVYRTQDTSAVISKQLGIRPPRHPTPLRCSSATNSRFAPSSRLAGRSPRRPRCPSYFRDHCTSSPWLNGLF